MTEPTQIKLKRKHSEEKPMGRQKGGHNDSRRKRERPRRKGSGKTEPINTIMVMLPSGKIRFERL